MAHPNSVRSIRNRLFLLLLRALVIAVAFLFLFTLVTTGIVLAYPSQSNPLYRLPLYARLETFYIARDSWQGVGTIFQNSLQPEAAQWRASTLLDAQNHVVVQHGVQINPSISPFYQPMPGDTITPILVDGQVVGKLVLGANTIPSTRVLTFRFLEPVLLVSLLLAVFATLIGLLLTRRVVSPLAEVIAAAEEIAGGRLQTRVRVKAPHDLRDLSDSFNKMADSMERNDRERRDMLADIAHELRTPLTILRGRLEGIIDGVYPADEKHIGPALEETYVLERLVEDLRLLTLAESRQLVFEKQPLDLTELAGHVINVFQPLADESQVQLGVEGDTSIPELLLDPVRTQQVVGNLVNNALRFVPAGGRIWIEVHAQDNGWVSIAVNDTGPGIPEADLPYIFNRFWRGDKSRSRSSGGAGLGLAIARQLVEAQGGKISARNLPGGGLQVKCEFLPA
jgi:two-component system OmpR family sensor kinase/two-component system sensor histidine kinase BaeS